jgi:transcriptional regulator with XRE-family HTH domain
MRYHKVINKRIYELCAKHDMSITKLAVTANIRPTTLHNIMLNKSSTNPKLDVLHKIAFVFNLTLAEFLDFPEVEKIAEDYFYDLNNPIQRGLPRD